VILLGSLRVPGGSRCEDWGFHGHVGKRGPNPGNQQVLLTHRQDMSLIHTSLSTAMESMGESEGFVWLFLTLGELGLWAKKDVWAPKVLPK